jgi:hypothetical protein
MESAKLLSTIYPDYGIECKNLITYSIIFTNNYLSKPVYLNIIVDMSVDISVDIPTAVDISEEIGIQSSKQLNLPYGIYDFQEQYIMSDGKIYLLPESILATVQDISQHQTILNDLILKIKNKVSILMPYVIGNGDSEKIKKYLGFKNIIMDFIIKENAKEIIKGDYYITNNHKGLTCTGCKVLIDSEHNCAVLKCCTSPFHFQCLLECYINAEENTTLKCPNCNNLTGKLDLEGKNSSILMGIFE